MGILSSRLSPFPDTKVLLEAHVSKRDSSTFGAQSTVPATEAQGVLFDDLVDTPGELGYRGPAACKAAGITYRQLDYLSLIHI